MFNLNGASPKALVKIFHIGNQSGFQWNESDYAGIFYHQLNTLLNVDLARSDQGLIASYSNSLGKAASFRDLFSDDTPPIELLTQTKFFAKQFLSGEEEGLPADVATALYYLAIAVARMKYQLRITSLDDVSLKLGLEWGLQQTWMDAEALTIFRNAIAFIQSSEDKATKPPKE